MISKGIGGRGVSREGHQVNHFTEHRAEVYSEKMISYLAPLQTLPAVDPDAQLQCHQLVQEIIRVALRNAMPTPPPEAKLLQALHYRCDVHTIMMVPSASYHDDDMYRLWICDGWYVLPSCMRHILGRATQFLAGEALRRDAREARRWGPGILSWSRELRQYVALSTLSELLVRFPPPPLHRHHMHPLQHAQT